MPAPLLVVNAPSLLYRAWFALPDKITGIGGMPVNALLGATNAILRIVADHRPRAVVICNGAEAARYRVERYGGYHADRPPVPDGLAAQFARAGGLFEGFGWTLAGTDELEADDLLHSFALTEVEAGGEALLMTGDRDMFQCATDAVTVLYLKTGVRGFEPMTPAAVEQRSGSRRRSCPTSSRCAAIPPTACPAREGSARRAPPTCCAATARSRRRSPTPTARDRASPERCASRPTSCATTSRSRRSGASRSPAPPTARSTSPAAPTPPRRSG